MLWCSNGVVGMKMVFAEVILASVAPFSGPSDGWQWHNVVFLGLVVVVGAHSALTLVGGINPVVFSIVSN